MYSISVPAGSIIPVIVNSPISGSTYSIPASGIVRDGWMVADGACIPAGHLLTGNTPNLTDGRYLMGSSSSGSTGGYNSNCVCVAQQCLNVSHTHNMTPSNICCHSTGAFSHCHTEGSLYTQFSFGDTTNCSYFACYTIPSGLCQYNNRATGSGFARSTTSGNTIDYAAGIGGYSWIGNTSAPSAHTGAAYSSSCTLWSYFCNCLCGGANDFNASGGNEPQYLNVRFLLKVS